MAEKNSSAPLKTAEGAYPALPASVADVVFWGDGKPLDIDWGAGARLAGGTSLYTAEQMRAYAAQAVAAQAPAAVADGDNTTREQYRRMFEAACVDLGRINEALGLDPDDGGADPILDAIEELRATRAAPQPQVEPTVVSEVIYRWQALDYSGNCYGSNPPTDLPARCNLTAFYRQPDAYRTALHEISATGNLTATERQFARHLQKIARDALAATPALPATGYSSAGDLAEAVPAREFICPTKTVSDLVNNLLLLDQSLPVYGAQYIDHPVRKRCAIAVDPTISRERVKDGRWIGQGDELNAVVIWTRAAQPAQAEVQAEPVYQITRPFTGDPKDTWRDASKDAYDYSLPNKRRILYAAPQAQPANELSPYSIDDDSHGIRARVAHSISGALGFGAQGVNPPPAGHWLTPFWESANAERSAITAPQAQPADALDDTKLLNFLRDECCDLRCDSYPSGGDDSEVYWKVIEHHMAKPHEREIGRSYSDEPRQAIRAAMAAAQEGGKAAKEA